MRLIMFPAKRIGTAKTRCGQRNEMIDSYLSRKGFDLHYSPGEKIFLQKVFNTNNFIT